MPSLLDVQHAVLRSIVDDDGPPSIQRLAIHRNAFDSGLAKALRLSYPAVHELVGADFFEGAARVFAHRHPPSSAWLTDYGADFAAFLAAFPPAASLAYLPDVARLEWAVTQALHAPDAAPLDARRLAAVDPERHEHVRFVGHPSLSLLHADHPADAVWRAVLMQDDEALRAIDPTPGAHWLLVARTAAGIDVEALDAAEWRFAQALAGGMPLGPALAMLPGVQASSLLAGHLAAGRFVDFCLEDERS